MANRSTVIMQKGKRTRPTATHNQTAFEKRGYHKVTAAQEIQPPAEAKKAPKPKQPKQEPENTLSDEMDSNQ